MKTFRLALNKFARIGVCGLVLSIHTSSFAEDLQQIYQLAIKNDPVFRAQQASLQAELEVRNQANAQLFLPNVSVSANLDRNYQDITSAFGGGDSQFTGKGYSLNLSQPIYHHDRYIHLKQVNLQVAKAQLEVGAAEQELMLRTARQYFSVLAAQDSLQFSKAEELALKRQLEESSQRFDVGLIAITDVHEAQAGFDLATAKELQAQNALEDAVESLREITGQYPQTLATLSDNLTQTSPEPNNIEAWAQAALKNNLQLKAKLVETEIIEKEISRQTSGHYPTVDLVGNHGYRSTGGQFGNTDADFSKIGVEINIPLYSGGQVSSKSREALHRHLVALENLEQARRSTERQCREAFRGILSGLSQIKAFKQAVISSETAVIATRTGYEVGTRTATDVVAAEQEFFRAQRDYSQAKYEYILDTLSLKQVSGTLLPADIQKINSSLNLKTQHSIHNAN